MQIGHRGAALDLKVQRINYNYSTTDLFYLPGNAAHLCHWTGLTTSMDHPIPWPLAQLDWMWLLPSSKLPGPCLCLPGSALSSTKLLIQYLGPPPLRTLAGSDWGLPLSFLQTNKSHWRRNRACCGAIAAPPHNTSKYSSVILVNISKYSSSEVLATTRYLYVPSAGSFYRID